MFTGLPEKNYEQTKRRDRQLRYNILFYAPSGNGVGLSARVDAFRLARFFAQQAVARVTRARVASRRSQRRLGRLAIDSHRKGSDGERMKRLWGIRHVRWLYLSWMLQRHLDRWQRMDMGWFAQQSDLDYLDRVWSGDA